MLYGISFKSSYMSKISVAVKLFALRVHLIGYLRIENLYSVLYFVMCVVRQNIKKIKNNNKRKKRKKLSAQFPLFRRDSLLLKKKNVHENLK